MGDVRIGRELFPWLMPLILLIFAVEHWLANRFYDEDAARGESRVDGRSRLRAPADEVFDVATPQRLNV